LPRTFISGRRGYVHTTQTRARKVVSRAELLSLVHRLDRIRCPDALGVLHLCRAQNRWRGRRTVQIYIRVETIFQRIDVRALLTALFFYITASDFRIDERGFADRGRGALRNTADDLYAPDLTGVAGAFEVYGDCAPWRSVVNVLHRLEFDNRTDLRRLG